MRRLGPHSCVTCMSLPTGWAIYKVKSSQVKYMYMYMHMYSLYHSVIQ